MKNIALPYSGPASATNGDTLYNAIASVSNTTPIRITTPSQHNLSEGATVMIDQVGGDLAANGTFKIGNVSRLTFDLFDSATGTTPIAPSGTYTTGGRWSYPLHPYVDSGADLTKAFYRVTGDDSLGTFLGTFVSVNGVDENNTTKKKSSLAARPPGCGPPPPRRRSDRCVWHPAAGWHLHVHFLRSSGDGRWSGWSSAL